MKHAQVRTLLGDYMEGDLATAEHTAIDEHLDGCPSCSQELRDLRSVVGLVRGLPDAEPSTDLAGAVMARIRAGEGAPRMRLIPGGLRRVAEPRVAAALAAGVAGLLAWTLLPSLPSLAPDPSAPLALDRESVEVALAEPAPRFTADAPSVPKRRPMDRREPSAGLGAAGIGLPLRAAAFQGGVAPTRPVLESSEIDRQLDRLWTDPTAVLNRMGRSPRGDILARLTQHAARRGRAADLAQRLLSSPHPMASDIVSRLLAASLAEDVQRRPGGGSRGLR